MDPITAMLLGSLVLTGLGWVGARVSSDAYATVKAAQAGAWDVIDRQRERRASFWQRAGTAWANRRRARHLAAGGDGSYRPGARAYLADVYHGFWEDQLAKRAAKRAARGPYTYDPDRLSWADRFDAAVLRRVSALRERWGQRVPEPAVDAPLDELLDGDQAPEPMAYDPGTWTVDEQGQRVALAPAEADDGTDDSAYGEDEHQGVVDAIHGTRDEGDTEMTAPTQASSVATEIQTNEDARQAFATISGLARQAQDALAALEAIVAQMKTATAATTDGMAAKKFDSAAQQAAFEAADAVDLGDVTEWYGKFEAAQQAADNGLASLAKWLDAESMVASENVDATTLAATSS